MKYRILFNSIFIGLSLAMFGMLSPVLAMHRISFIRSLATIQKQQQPSNFLLGVPRGTQHLSPHLTQTPHRRTIYPTRDLKGIYEIMPENYKGFSPWFGAACYENGLIRKIHKFGDEKDKTTQLVRELFHVNKHNDTLLENQKSPLTISCLTPNIIGQVLGALKHRTLKNNEGLLKLIQEEHRQFVENQRIKNISFKINRKTIYDFFDLIIDAKEEEHIKELIPNTTHNTLLALLYHKAKTKKDVLGFIDGLSVDLDDLHISKKSKETFLESSYTDDDSEYFHKKISHKMKNQEKYIKG